MHPDNAVFLAETSPVHSGLGVSTMRYPRVGKWNKFRYPRDIGSEPVGETPKRRVKVQKVRQTFAVSEHKYKPLSEIRASSISRRCKRLIHFIKYRALGILPLPKGRISIIYAPPLSTFDLINEGGVYIEPFAQQSKVTTNSDILVEPAHQIAVDHNDIKISLDKQFETRMEEMFGKLGTSCFPYSSVTVKNEMGVRLPFSNLEECKEYCRKHFITQPDMLFSKELDGGGRHGKRGAKKKRRRVRRPRSAAIDPPIRGGQLGLKNPLAMRRTMPFVREFWVYEQIFETDATGNISLYFSLRNPLTAINGSGVYPRAQELAKLYDIYKPIRLDVVIDFLYLNPQVGDGAASWESDSIPSGPYTYAQLIEHPPNIIESGTNQLTCGVKIPILTEASYQGRICPIHKGGFYDFAYPPDEGFLALALERYSTGVRQIRATVRVEVLLSQRRTLGITRLEYKKKLKEQLLESSSDDEPVIVVPPKKKK